MYKTNYLYIQPFLNTVFKQQKMPQKGEQYIHCITEKKSKLYQRDQKRFDLLIFLLSSRLIHGVRSFSSISLDYLPPGWYRHLLNVEDQSFWSDNAGNPPGLPAATFLYCIISCVQNFRVDPMRQCYRVLRVNSSLRQTDPPSQWQENSGIN